MKKYICNEDDINELIDFIIDKEFDNFSQAYTFIKKLSNKYEKIMYVLNPTRNLVDIAIEQGYERDFKLPMYGVSDFIVGSTRIVIELLFIKNQFVLSECDRILIYKIKEVKLRNDKLIILSEYAYNRSAILTKEENYKLGIKRKMENELVNKHIVKQIINSSYSKFSQMHNLLIKFSNDSNRFVSFLNNYLKVTPRGEIRWNGKY